MARLYAKNLKTCNSSLAVQEQTALEIAQNDLSETYTDNIIEQVQSDSQSPVKRVRVAKGLEIAVVPTTASKDLMESQLNLDISSGFSFPNRDVMYDVMRDDGNLETHLFKNMEMSGDLSVSFNPNDAFYTPLTFVSTKTSEGYIGLLVDDDYSVTSQMVIFVDTTSDIVDLTTTLSTTGDEVIVIDYAGNFGTNKATFAGNDITTDNSITKFTYNGATWDATTL